MYFFFSHCLCFGVICKKWFLFQFTSFLLHLVMRYKGKSGHALDILTSALHQVWSFQIFFEYSFLSLSPLFLPLLPYYHYAYAGMLNGVPHFSKALFIVIHPCFSLLLWLHNLYWSTFNFIDSYFWQIKSTVEPL